MLSFLYCEIFFSSTHNVGIITILNEILVTKILGYLFLSFFFNCMCTSITFYKKKKIGLVPHKKIKPVGRV